jgi:nucleotide-binding universal stress UspA family protein
LQSIVAAFDLSPIARRVVQRARLIAGEHDGHLSLVHVAEDPDFPLPDDLAERLYLYRHSRAEELLATMNARGDCAVDVKVLRGAIAPELAKLTRKADLLVTGTSSVDTQRVGPRTTRLARKVHSPLLAVRRQPRGPYRRVVAAVDLSDASRAAVDLALNISGNAEVIALAVLPANAEILLAESGIEQERLAAVRTRRMADLEEATAKFAAEWGDRVTTAVEYGPPPDAIGEFARRAKADLVTVGSRGAAQSPMVLLGSVAEAVMESVPCDVAVARVPGRFRRP